jgi:hypothetical protein
VPEFEKKATNHRKKTRGGDRLGFFNSMHESASLRSWPRCTDACLGVRFIYLTIKHPLSGVCVWEPTPYKTFSQSVCQFTYFRIECVVIVNALWKKALLQSYVDLLKETRMTYERISRNNEFVSLNAQIFYCYYWRQADAASLRMTTILATTTCFKHNKFYRVQLTTLGRGKSSCPILFIKGSTNVRVSALWKCTDNTHV